MTRQSRLLSAALVGAVGILGVLTWDVGLPPRASLLDPIFWTVYGFIALSGAFACVSAVLACEEAWNHPAWLYATLAGVVLVTLPFILPFVRETREARQFAAVADTTMGVVHNKFARGPGIYLTVNYEVSGRQHQLTIVGDNPFVGTPAFSTLRIGESVRVFYQPTNPDNAMVGRPGPEIRLLVELLLKVCGVVAVLITAYLPPVVRFVRPPVVAAPPNEGW